MTTSNLVLFSLKSKCSMDSGARGKINRLRLNGQQAQRKQKAMRSLYMTLMHPQDRVGGIGSYTIFRQMLPR